MSEACFEWRKKKLLVEDRFDQEGELSVEIEWVGGSESTWLNRSQLERLHAHLGEVLRGSPPESGTEKERT